MSSDDIQTQTTGIETDDDHTDLVDPYDDTAEINRAKQVNAVLYFAGVNPREAADGVELPAWWSRRLDGRDVRTSLRGAIRQLPTASSTEVAWKNPITGEWIKTEKHNAVINPALIEAIELRALALAFAVNRDMDYQDARDLVEGLSIPGATAQLRDDMGVESADALLNKMMIRSGDQALWNVPSDSYTIINPVQFLDPLCDAIEDSDLGDVVFGEFELSRGGGRVKGDIYFDGAQIDLSHLDGDREPVMLGIEVGWDFFNGRSASACGIAMDTSCKNSMRALTDRIAVKHTGDAESRINFWDDLLEEIQVVADDLTQMIIDAADLRVDFRDLPFGVREFYVHLGFPGYLARRAAEDVTANADDPFNPTYWDLHSGATYALTHHADAGADRVEELNRSANDLLFNPAPAVETVRDNYRRDVEQRLAAQSDDDQTGLSGDGVSLNDHQGIAQVSAWSDDIQGMKAQYEERQEAIKGRFKAARRSDDD